MMDEGAAILTIKINNKEPVELIDLTNGLLSLAEEYKRFSGQQDVASPEDVKLYIKEIRSGSIIADIMACAPGILPYVGQATSIITFSTYLKKAYNFLTGKTGDKTERIDRNSYENLSRFVETTAKDISSEMFCYATINGNVKVEINITSLEANAAQNRAKREIGLLKEPVMGIKKKALLYWYQARSDTKSQAGDRAVIESIYKGPVKTICNTDEIKINMIYTQENPFMSAYIVDVQVSTINDRPVVYNILHVHDRFDKPTDN